MKTNNVEKSQDQIKFENLFSNSLSGWWKQCPFKSLGCVLHWIYVYGTLNIAETVTVGEDHVCFQGSRFLDIQWNEDLGMPIFSNLKDAKYQWLMDNQQRYLKGLDKYKEYVENTTKRYNEIRKSILQKNK